MMAPAKVPTMEGIWAVRFKDGQAGLFQIHERPVSKKLVTVIDAISGDEIEVDEIPNVDMWYGPMPAAAPLPATVKAHMEGRL